MSNAPVRYHIGKFPPVNLDWQQLIPLIGPARGSLERYDALLSTIPNAHVLLSPLTTQEAVLSSMIEGTTVTIGEVLEIEAGAKPESYSQPKLDDAEEVLNYRKAMRACSEAMAERPFSQHMLRSAHAILLQGVRGREKSPGSYRDQQNLIGRPGCTLETASFIPIGMEYLQQGMDDWEQFFRRTDLPDILVQLAILHVEFEALHPFKDGNGRLGRMIIPLFLYQRKLLTSPDFYMSGYLEANRPEYQERLRAVSRDDDWTGWCVFFLKGIKAQAAENERKARAILDLYNRVKEQMMDEMRSLYAINAVDFIFKAPIFPSTLFTKHSEIPRPSATRLLILMRKAGLLKTISERRGRKEGFYAFRELLNIAEGADVF
jgi:Fic family protein